MAEVAVASLKLQNKSTLRYRSENIEGAGRASRPMGKPIIILKWML